MVGHHLEGDDLPPALVRLLPNQFVQASRDPAVEDRTAVLRAPHHVEPEVVHAAGGPANRPGRSHTMYLYRDNRSGAVEDGQVNTANPYARLRSEQPREANPRPSKTGRRRLARP